jgi:hypothetical protein
MPINFPLIQEAKIQYGNLALGELLTIPLGVGLWLWGLKLRRTGQGLKRATGVVLLLLALLYTIGWLIINGLVVGTGLGVL